MNWLTFLLIALIGFATWRAYRNGFVRELVTLCAVILAIPIAGIFYDDMVPKVEPITDDPELARLISFTAILVGVVLAGYVGSFLLRQAVTMLNLGSLDSGAGALFGFFKAVLLCQVALVALVLFPSPDLREAIDDSFLATALLDSAGFTLTILPDRFDAGVTFFLSSFSTAAAEPAAVP